MAGGLRKMAVRLALASAVVVTVVLTALPALANIIEGNGPSISRWSYRVAFPAQPS